MSAANSGHLLTLCKRSMVVCAHQFIPGHSRPVRASLKNMGFPDLAAEQTMQLKLQVKIFAPAAAIDFPGFILAGVLDRAHARIQVEHFHGGLRHRNGLTVAVSRSAVGNVTRPSRSICDRGKGSAGLTPATRLIK